MRKRRHRRVKQPAQSGTASEQRGPEENPAGGRARVPPLCPESSCRLSPLSSVRPEADLHHLVPSLLVSIGLSQWECLEAGGGRRGCLPRLPALPSGLWFWPPLCPSAATDGSVQRPLFLHLGSPRDRGMQAPPSPHPIPSWELLLIPHAPPSHQ